MAATVYKHMQIIIYKRYTPLCVYHGTLYRYAASHIVYARIVYYWCRYLPDGLTTVTCAVEAPSTCTDGGRRRESRRSGKIRKTFRNSFFSILYNIIILYCTNVTYVPPIITAY